MAARWEAAAHSRLRASAPGRRRRCRLEAGGEHGVGGVEVGAQPGRAVAQQAGVAVACVEQVVEQFAADPLFGLGGGAAGEQQQ